MAHCNTILGQFLALFPRHEFEKIRREVQPKAHARALSAWTQFVAMLSGRLAGRDRLRGMVDALAPQGRKLYQPVEQRSVPCQSDFPPLPLSPFVWSPR